MSMSDATIWTIIVVLAVGTYLIRFSFLGLIGNKVLPDWLIRHLRYTPVAVIPGLVAPLVVWPEATGGSPDPVRLTATVATIAAGYLSKNFLVAAGVGAATLAVGVIAFG